MTQRHGQMPCRLLLFAVYQQRKRD